MLTQTTVDQVMARLHAVVSARASAGDTKLASFSLGVQDLGNNGSTPTGCGWHPSAADHKRMSGVLKSQLVSTLDW
jgi:hypothetical protein